MAEYEQYLAILDTDPGNDGALDALAAIASAELATPDAAKAFDEARDTLVERGELETVERLFDVEIEKVDDNARRADLWLKKGHLYADEFLNERSAVECFNRVLELRPDDESAQEVLAEIGLVRDNWQKIVEKYLDEARVSTDRQLTTSLYLSAAETYARYQEAVEPVEEYLRKALEVEPRNRRAAHHLERLLRTAGRWQELAELLEQRVDAVATKEERIQALLGVADLCRTRLEQPERAVEYMKRVVSTDPAHPRALQILAELYEKEENWSALVMLYTNALKARRRSVGREPQVGMLMQIAMLHWKRLRNADAAEEYFRRVRKAEPAHAAALEFYREYYPQRGEVQKLLQVLRQALKATPEDQPEARRALQVEIAGLAENQLANPEKAIDSWKSILRKEPDNADARSALKRLYRQTEKWNALLDLMKDEIERLDKGDKEGRIAGLLAVSEIYRDRLKLDVMVINTFNSILQIDPEYAPALDALADKYKELGRWNDLIAILTRKAGRDGISDGDRAALLREIAGLWADRFGNYAQAIKPLEQLLEVAPGDRDAIARLKEIYTRRRQWRNLIALMQRELALVPVEGRRDHLVDVARLASDRLGDPNLAIEVWNQVLEVSQDDADALASLGHLYERGKRWMALAEVYRRLIEQAEGADAVANLEKLGSLYADRLAAPDQAAEALRKVLDLDPSHGRALRTLRDIYVQTGDADSLVSLYSKLEQYNELVDVLTSMAERIPDEGDKRALLLRTAGIAGQHLLNQDKIGRAYERVLAIDETNLEAAQALVPVYQQTRKWARLLSTYEILLEHETDEDKRLGLIVDIRDLCEQHIGSKALAFSWTTKAYELRPDDEQLLSDLERLGAEADAWEDVARVLDARAGADNVDESEKLRLLRTLGQIAAQRLHKADDARRYQLAVLELKSDDSDALDALEKLATEQSRWPDLLEVYRRRVDLTDDDSARLDLMFKIGFIEEERVNDLDAAARTYEAILDLDGHNKRALKALEKVQEERGDASGLAKALERELELARETDSRVGLLLRLGALYEESLGRRDDALTGYKEALSLAPRRAQVHSALERFAVAGSENPLEQRAEIAGLLLPVYEQIDDTAAIARNLATLREAADDDNQQLAYDRKLVRLYVKLDDSANAYAAAARVFDRAPDDQDNRRAAGDLAVALDCVEDLAARYEKVLQAPDERGLDSATHKNMAHEVANLYDERLTNPEQGEVAWRRLLGIDPAEEHAYHALDRLLRGAERWEELRALLIEREENTVDAGRRKEILLQICDLDEGVLENAEGAIATFARVLEIDPTLMRAYKALERLYDERDMHAELEQLLGAELEHLGVEDAADEQRISLIYRRALLRARHLDDREGAVDLLEEIVNLRPGHTDARELLEELVSSPEQRHRVARLLEPLYQNDGLWRDLCLVLRAQREFADQPEQAVDLLARIAEIEEERLAHERAAYDTWSDAFETNPTDARPRQALLRMSSLLDRWGDAATLWEKVAEESDTGDLALRAELLAELAAIYDQHLADADNAQTAYQRLLDVDPGNPETSSAAAVALDRLYAEAQKWNELVDIVRRQAEWAETADARTALLARVAHVQEEYIEDSDAAVATWRELLGENPDDTRALDALERIFVQREMHPDLIDVLRRRVESAADPGQRKAHLQRIARLFEHELEDETEAIGAHLEVLDHVADDGETLIELSRLYRSTSRFTDLLDITERRLALAGDEAERVALTCELGDLLLNQLDRHAEALEHFARVLASNPSHVTALAAVESMLDDEDLRQRAAEVLQPIYEDSGEHEKLAGLLLRLADSTEDPREQVRCLTRVAEIRERRLNDNAGAFEAFLRVVRAAAAEPELPDFIAQLERLASADHREADLIAIYKEVAPDVLDAELQRRLYLDIADLSRGVLNDDAEAREYYERVLDAQPDDPRAMAALEYIYRESEEHARLYEILNRKAELNEDNLEARAAALTEAAKLCAGPLARPEDGVVHYETVLEIVPDDKHAADALEALYQQNERWHDLADLLERRLGFAFTVAEAVALRFRLGGLYESELHDPERAVENYAAALGGDPDHAGATAALERFLDDPGARNEAAEVLEPIYVASQAWPKLVRIYEIKLDASEDPVERLQLTRYIARLYEDQLEDMEEAFRWYGRVFRERPDDRGMRDQLTRLANILENWEGLANVYQEYLDDETSDDETTATVALALADLYDHRLDEVERGQAAYRRVLQYQPDDSQTFGKLESMLYRAERWYALVEAYEEAVNQTMDNDRRLDLYARTAAVHEDKLQDMDRAIESYRAMLDIDMDHEHAVAHLRRLFDASSQWYELVELLQTRIERTENVAARSELRLELAEVQERHLEDPNGAIDQYEIVLDSGPAGHDRALAALERLVVDEDYQERIAAVLEPIYRHNDWWQKLVVILDARLKYIAEPAQRVQSLREIARIHESRGGDHGLALQALSRAWKEDVQNGEVYDELAALAAKLGAWDTLVETLESGIDGNYDFDLVALVLARIAEIHETHRNDADEAVSAWKRLLEVREDDDDAMAELDRLYAARGAYEDQARIVERRAEMAAEDHVRRGHLIRLAGLQETQLERSDDAIATWRAVLSMDDTDGEALEALTRLFRDVEDYTELSMILSRKIELATDPAVRRDLRLTAAEVNDGKLSDAYEAIAQLNAILDEGPDDKEALIRLDVIYGRERMFGELLEVVDKRTQLATERPERVELSFRAAQLVERELLESERAIERYAAVLDHDPGHPGAREALDSLAREEDTMAPAIDVLDKLYRGEGAFDKVAELYERKLAGDNPEPAERVSLYAALAEVHEVARGDLDDAFRVWARALAEHPHEVEPQTQLDRLAADRTSWQELIDVYDKRLDDIMDGELEYAFATKIAGLYEDALGESAKAAEYFQRALGVANDEREPLAALDRLYERDSRWSELEDILAREADVTMDEEQQAEFLYRLGDVRERQLNDASGAVSSYRDVLDRNPQHSAARAALERLLSSDAERSEIISILEPLYENEADWARLADLLGAKLGIARDAFDRAALYQRIAELAEKALGDSVRALDATGGWLAEDPQSVDALAELERLADATGRWSEVAARLKGIVDSTDSDDVRQRLTVRLGQIQLSRLGDGEAAEKTFKSVLELDSESEIALEALEQVYRQWEDQAALADVLSRRGDLLFDAQRKRTVFVEVAQLREQLGQLDEAIAAWKECLDVDEGDREAHGNLARIYEQRQSWEELVDVLRLASRFADSPAYEKPLRTRLAQVLTDNLDRPDDAIDAWTSVLDVEPTDPEALDRLEVIHGQRGDWMAVQDVLVRRLDNADNDEQRKGIYRRMARIALDERGEPDEAIGYLHQILDVDNSDLEAYAELERVLVKSERWHDLVEILARVADVVGTLGDTNAEIGYLARAADVWEEQLENPDAAGEILEKILKREPNYVPAFARLARIYEAASEWDKCSEVLQRALGLGPTGRDAADIYYRLGEVARNQSGDEQEAAGYYERALEQDELHPQAVAAVERAARERDDWPMVADMVSRRERVAEDESEKLELTLELADLYTNKLGQPDAVIPLLERAAQVAPEDPRVLGPLADLYFAAGRSADAQPIYESLADEAKKKRRMKDVARYRQRIGGIAEAAGQADVALGAYEEAFRINPTDVQTMAGLGRLYMTAQDWEKARRVYRSMVLQNIDPAVGISKAQVYLQLGNIHVQLGESPKAKGMFQRGLELEPDNAELKAALAAL